MTDRTLLPRLLTVQDGSRTGATVTRVCFRCKGEMDWLAGRHWEAGVCASWADLLKTGLAGTNPQLNRTQSSSFHDYLSETTANPDPEVSEALERMTTVIDEDKFDCWRLQSTRCTT